MILLCNTLTNNLTCVHLINMNMINYEELEVLFFYALCGLVATSPSSKVLAAPPGVDGFFKFCAASCLFLALLGLEHSSLFKVVTSSPQHCRDSPSALPRHLFSPALS